MARIKTFFRRLSAGSFKRMFMHINTVHAETGKNRFIMFFDMIWCIFRYGVGYMDYRVFGFALIKGRNRRTFMTMNDNITISKNCNDRAYFPLFDDKAKFDERFKEYIGRDFLDLANADANALKRFCKGKDAIFAKPKNKFGGEGITREKITDSTDYEALYNRLVKDGQLLCEQALTQHETMNLLSPSSVNTIRMVTLLHEGRAHFMYALVRMSNGEACVDNICSGGMYVSIGNDGVITKPAYCDATGVYYDAHPYTKTKFDGFKIPMFESAVEMCKRAALEVPQVGYIGWDVAITPTGPAIVEGNTLPSYDMCQNYGHIDNKTGIKPRFTEILGEDYFKNRRKKK